MSPKSILIIGSFDTKGPEYALLRELILSRGHHVIAVNIGVLGTTDLFPVEVEADQVAEAGGASLGELRRSRDHAYAIKVMHRGAAIIASQLYERRRFDGIVGMGGGCGTAIVTAAMRALPLGVPKVCLTTMMGGDVRDYIGAKDLVLIPAIVDLAGLNSISRLMIGHTAAAICGMVTAPTAVISQTGQVIAATMYGNTTPCVNACKEALTARGYEVMIFHATGGGRTMEALVEEGLFKGVLDITTTEWADELCGGLFGAGVHRLEAPGKAGIPHLIAPGCVDMVNFGPPNTVPERYRSAGRKFHYWNPAATLMRTNIEENRQMGRIFAEKANAAKGPVAFALPLRGVSMLDADGAPFRDREADRAFFDSLKTNLRNDIRVIEVDANINDPAFAEKAVAIMLELINHK